MNPKIRNLLFSASLVAVASSPSAFAATAAFPTLSSLGESLFSDSNLSFSRTQSCSSCHNPEQAFIDTRANGVGTAVSLCHDDISLGHRNAPTISYAQFSPNFTGTNANNARGGQFWDGRASNLSTQAEGPPLNPLEMGMLNKADVVARLQENSDYVEAFKSYFGDSLFDDTEIAYTAMAESLAEFEQSDAISPFDSKFDRSLEGTYTMTAAEQRGMNLYFSNGTNCTRCHSTTGRRGGANQRGIARGRGGNRGGVRDGGRGGAGAPPPNGLGGDRLPAVVAGTEIFTNFRYFNNGTPSNTTLNSFLQSVGQQTEFLSTGDQGLFDNPLLNANDNNRGHFKVPTLRNIAVTAPYMHNGVFQNLNTVLAFYDHQGGNQQRANNPETGTAWAAAETPNTVDRRRLQMRNLNNNDIDNLECFLRTLTDQTFEDKLPTLREGLSCS
jgi:cytochrome c peroxidase